MRAAVIGGGFGRYCILPALLLNKSIDVVAVCTSTKTTVEQFAKQYNIPTAYDSWSELLKNDIDILAIATPPAVQAEITDIALSKKIPVFLEKQIALNDQQSEKLISVATRQNVPSCVNYIFPYLATWQRLRQFLQEGLLGNIRQVFVNWRMESYDNCRKRELWKTNDEQGGGILQHFLSHSFYYLEYLFGPIKEMRCTLSSASDLPLNGSCFASLDLIFDSFVAHIAASSAAYGGVGHHLEIYGSNGSLILKNEATDPVLGFKLYKHMRGSEVELIDAEYNHISGVNDSRVVPTSHLVNAFVNSLNGGQIMHPTIMDGHRVQRLISLAKVGNVGRDFVKVSKE